MRLQVARRHVDNHAPAAAGADRLELRGEDVVVPASREQGARVELVETMLCEARKIGAKQRLILARTMGFGRRHSADGVCAVVAASRPSGPLSTPPRRAAHGQPLHMLRRSLAISCCTTSLSVG